MSPAAAMPDGVMREAIIDVAAITANVRHLRNLTGAEVIAVVKADGYGHGAERSARAALEGGAARLGVADIGEALALRRAGIDAPLLAWLHAPGADFAEAAAHRIELGISSLDQLRAAAAASTADRATLVHLKVETGLGRNGIAPADQRIVFAEAARLERLGRVRVVGVFSHLSNTSDADDRAALARFEEALGAAADAGLTPQVRHLAATHAAIDLPEARFGCVRIGIGMYGLSPFADRTSADLGLRPAMTVRAAVAAVRRVPAGQGVSYGYLHRTDAETTLALVPLGYADGIPRSASGGAAVQIGDRAFPVAGRIAMDQFVVDVGDHPVAVGDEAVLFGDPSRGRPPVEAWATAAGTINYEIVTRIGPRVTRRAVSVSGLAAFEGEREIASPEAMEELGRRLGAALVAGDLVVLTGALGAGKTTLTRGIADGLGVRGPVQSPTFVIARTHPSLVDGPPLVHVDAYRLGSPAELDDLGLDLDRSVTIVEWGRGMVDGLVDKWWEVELDREWGGTGLDNACGTSGPAAREMDDTAPRRVTITRHP